MIIHIYFFFITATLHVLSFKRNQLQHIMPCLRGLSDKNKIKGNF